MVVTLDIEGPISTWAWPRNPAHEHDWAWLKFPRLRNARFLLFNRNRHSQKWRHKNLTEHICLAVNAFAFVWHTLSSKNHPTLPIRFPFKDFKSPQCCSSIHADLWKGEHIKDIDALMCLHPHATNIYKLKASAVFCFRLCNDMIRLGFRYLDHPGS